MHFIVLPFSVLITMEKQINCEFYTHKYITIGSIALNIVPLVDSSILPNRYYFFRLDHKVCVKKPLQVSNWTITETSLFTAWTIFSFTVSLRKCSFKLIDLLKSKLIDYSLSWRKWTKNYIARVCCLSIGFAIGSFIKSVKLNVNE